MGPLKRSRRFAGLRAQRVGDFFLLVFHTSYEVYSWIRSVLALTGLVSIAVTLLAPSSFLSFGTYRQIPTAGQLMSCSAVEGTLSTWVCDSQQGIAQDNSNGDTSLTQ